MSGRRIGLVLGAGGMLGAAWTVGVLCALEKERRIDPTRADVIIGTSAGSVVGALLAAGVGPQDMAAHQRGRSVPAGPLAGIAFDYGITNGSGRPPTPPEPRLGSPSLLRRIVRRPGDYRLPALLAAVMPRGRGSIGALPELIGRLLPVWPDGQPDGQPDLLLCTMDLTTGRRRVLSSADASLIDPAGAVTASCAVPGWFTPVPFDGRELIDGGSYSFNSVDVAAGRGLDEVIVIAPLAHQARVAQPGSVGRALLRWWRLPPTRQMYDEAEVVRSEGTDVRVICPSAEELAVLGMNPMDETRRLEVLETALRVRR